MPAPEPHGPWVDLHAHPGRCFLAGLPADDPFASLLGGDGTAEAISAAAEAGVAAVSVATVADLRVLGATPEGGLRATRAFDPGESHADNERQLAGFAAHAQRRGLRMVRTADDIWTAHADGTTALFVTCEGADFVEDDLGRVADVHGADVRSITIVHYAPNRFADLQTEAPVHGGLSDAGRELVREMNRVGMVVDLAHATFEATIDALEVSSDPVMISHTHLTGARGDHPRLVSRDHARAVADAGGLIGAWPSGVTSSTFADFVDEIARLVDTVGVDHVAVGTDMDANYKPVMTSHGEFASIAEGLAVRGFASSDVDRVLGGNALALIEAVCG
jgi:membrane dipeptidase